MDQNLLTALQESFDQALGLFKETGKVAYRNLATRLASETSVFSAQQAGKMRQTLLQRGVTTSRSSGFSTIPPGQKKRIAQPPVSQESVDHAAPESSDLNSESAASEMVQDFLSMTDDQREEKYANKDLYDELIKAVQELKPDYKPQGRSYIQRFRFIEKAFEE